MQMLSALLLFFLLLSCSSFCCANIWPCDLGSRTFCRETEKHLLRLHFAKRLLWCLNNCCQTLKLLEGEGTVLTATMSPVWRCEKGREGKRRQVRLSWSKLFELLELLIRTVARLEAARARVAAGVGAEAVEVVGAGATAAAWHSLPAQKFLANVLSRQASHGHRIMTLLVVFANYASCCCCCCAAAAAVAVACVAASVCRLGQPQRLSLCCHFAFSDCLQLYFDFS